MKNIKTLFIIFILFALLIFWTGCSLKSIVTKALNTSTQSSESINESSTDLNKLLEKQKFEVSKDQNLQYLYVIIPDKNDPKIQKYDLTNKGTTEINVLKNKNFLFSLSANKSARYIWNLDSELDESFIILKEKLWWKPALSGIIDIGEDKDRYNLLFSALRSGRHAIKIKYEHAEKKDSTMFESTIIITGK